MSSRAETPLDIARTHWGEELPDWVEALARACVATSQNKVAAQLGRSPSLVSAVLRQRYPGSLAAVEELVRGVCMAATVDCPSLGELPMHECSAWRVKARSFENTNSLRVRMFRACHACPRFVRPETGGSE